MIQAVLFASMAISCIQATALSYRFADPHISHRVTLPTPNFSGPNGIGTHSNKNHILISSSSGSRYLYLKLTSMSADVVQGPTCMFTINGVNLNSWTITNIPDTGYFYFSFMQIDEHARRVDLSDPMAPVVLDAAVPQVAGTALSTLRLLDRSLNLMVTGNILTLFDYTSLPMTAVSVINSFTYSAPRVVVLNSKTVFALIVASTYYVVRVDVTSSGIALGEKLTMFPNVIASALFTVPAANLVVACESSSCYAVQNSPGLPLKWSFTMPGAVSNGWGCSSEKFFVADNSKNVRIFNGLSATGSSMYDIKLSSNLIQGRFTFKDEYMIITTSTSIEYLANYQCNTTNCKRCDLTDACLECSWPYTLESGICVLICDQSCSTCSGVTDADCKSCKPGFYLEKQISGSYCSVCHPLCIECEAADFVSCTKCKTSKGFILQDGSCVLPPTHPLFDCEPLRGLINISTMTCVACMQLTEFYSNSACQTARTDIVYVDYEVSLNITVPESNDILPEFILGLKIIDPQDILKRYAPIDIMGDPQNQKTGRFELLTSPRLNAKVDKSNETAIWLRVLDLGSEIEFYVNSTTQDDVERNSVYINKTHRLVLLAKSQVLRLNLEESLRIQSDHDWLFTRKIDKYLRGAISFAIPAVFIGNLISLDFNSGLIKLFQLMEIIGKFYFAPIQYCVHMHKFLYFVWSLSDFLKLNLESILPPPYFFTTKYYDKLSRNQITKRVLKEDGNSVLIFIFICIAYLADRILSICKPKLQKKLTPYRDIAFTHILELNFVDALFYTSFALTSDYDTSHNPELSKYIANKLVAVTIFMFYVTYACFKLNRSLTCKTNRQLASLARQHGLKEESCRDAWVLCLEPLYYWRLTFTVIIIVMSQFSSLVYLVVFSIVNILLQFSYFFIVMTHRPYRSLLSMMEAVTSELTIFLINWILVFSYSKSYPWILRQLFMIFIALTMMFQVVNAFVSLIKNMRLFCKKVCNKKTKPVTRPDSSLKATSTLAASIKSVLRKPETIKNKEFEHAKLNLRRGKLLAISQPKINIQSRDKTHMQRTAKPPQSIQQNARQAIAPERKNILKNEIDANTGSKPILNNTTKMMISPRMYRSTNFARKFK